MASQDYEIYRPTTRPRPEPPMSAGPPVRSGRRTHGRRPVGGCGMHGKHGAPNWVVVSGVCVAIWLMTGAGYFWPMWVMLGLGIPALMRHR